ncbi:MAG TPA: hypothetical protein VF177_01625 [Anaerolineae bacterium]
MQKARLIYPLVIAALASLLWSNHANSNFLSISQSADTFTATFAKVASINENSTQSTAGQRMPALVQDEPTAVNGYPGPAETPPPATLEGYPAVQSSPQPAVTSSDPVAPATIEGGAPPIPIIGEQSETLSGSETAASSREASPRQATQGRVFLWGGFIVALLLFITAVAGSIVLFTRQRG